MLTNNDRKTLASLATPKGRKATGCFMAQGEKCVADTLGHFTLRRLLHTDSWACPEAYADVAELVKPCDLKEITSLNTTPPVIAVYEIPQEDEDAADNRRSKNPKSPISLRNPMSPISSSELVLALDCVQDPGNLGTIIRVADWMGVERIFASPDTADVWNPKVVQATMGAISRIRVVYCDLAQMIKSNPGVPVYGTFMHGADIYKSPLSPGGIIVMGNEGKGISPAIESLVTQRITIPSFPPGRPTSESLNVAIATAITLAEFRRKNG